jgi:C4-dicarboxylate-specific signal transduction histidine kinase
MKKRLLALISVMLFVASVTALMIYQVRSAKVQQLQLLHESVLQEAIAHFESMVIVRCWNATHGGVYVKMKGDIKPNPYLPDNTLRTDENETLVKINPAWMTRQISEIANSRSDYYYKITSLKPLNPANAPDDFEREALEYFGAHPEQPYYWREGRSSEGSKERFNLMGALEVSEECLSCHGAQGYRVGDIRGGIRVSVPMANTNRSIALQEERATHMTYLIIFVALSALGIIGTLLMKLMGQQERLETFNRELERKVKARTEELEELNINLEEHVQAEVLKNSEKEQYLLAQSRHAAMGEVAGILAHNWRQPISVIAMGINNLLVDLELGEIDPQTLKTELNLIVEETQHLSRLIDDFRGHFEEDQNAFSPICDIADEVLSMMGESLGNEDIEVFRIYDTYACQFKCSRELLQVYMHLVSNAKEAMQKSDVMPKNLILTVAQDEEQLFIAVANTGATIDDEDMPQIFDPYFTTKTQQHAVGLGLYISKIIIEKYFGGSIRVYNTSNGVCAEASFPKQGPHIAP